jgi:hypothetical protein
MRRYRYIGPDAIRARPRGEPGTCIRSQAECWPAVAAAAIPAPSSFTHAFRFRRCAACMQINVVKEDWFVCASCDAELPRSWNFDP